MSSRYRTLIANRSHRALVAISPHVLVKHLHHSDLVSGDEALTFPRRDDLAFAVTVTFSDSADVCFVFKYVVCDVCTQVWSRVPAPLPLSQQCDRIRLASDPPPARRHPTCNRFGAVQVLSGGGPQRGCRCSRRPFNSCMNVNALFAVDLRQLSPLSVTTATALECRIAKVHYRARERPRFINRHCLMGRFVRPIASAAAEIGRNSLEFICAGGCPTLAVKACRFLYRSRMADGLLRSPSGTDHRRRRNSRGGREWTDYVTVWCRDLSLRWNANQVSPLRRAATA